MPLDSMSCRLGSPAEAADHANVELKKMSDSRTSPVTVSTMNEVDPSTLSRSGRLLKPRTVARAPEAAVAPVKPTNCDDIVTSGAAAHVAKARPAASRNCGADTLGTSLFVTK